VGSAERLARTTTRQPLTDGTRISNQTTRQRNTLPDRSRDPGNHSRLLFPVGFQINACLCRWSCPSGSNSDGKGRGVTITFTEERIQGLGTLLRQLFRQERDQLYHSILDTLGRR